jgi:hypothetical protein
MTEIKLKNQTIKINFDTQLTPKGRPFRLSGLEKITDQFKIVEKVQRWNWIYTFKMLDDNSFFGVKIGFNNEFIQVVK